MVVRKIFMWRNCIQIPARPYTRLTFNRYSAHGFSVIS